METYPNDYYTKALGDRLLNNYFNVIESKMFFCFDSTKLYLRYVILTVFDLCYSPSSTKIVRILQMSYHREIKQLLAMHFSI
jgi:hypothetical protein